LLAVLLPEIGPGRLDEVEQGRHARGHATEVSGPRRALEHFPKPADVHARNRTVWVHLLDARQEGHIDAERFEHRQIGGLVARVFRVVLVRCELGGVDEDAHYDRLAFGARPSYEAGVAFMHGSHGWHEPDRPRQRRSRGRQLDACPNDPQSTRFRFIQTLRRQIVTLEVEDDAATQDSLLDAES